MNWNISAYKTLEKCPRRWFYQDKAANGNAKNDKERVEITRLKKLKTIDGWRGDIVDQIISEVLILKIKRKERVVLEDLLQVARNIFDKQFLLASGQLSDINGRPPEFVFIDTEFGRTISEEKKQQAWRDIELAIYNFINDELLMKELREANLLLAQWMIPFMYKNINVTAIPDLIAFYNHKPPKIFDWKVHTNGTHPSEEQLLTYAIALTRTKPQDQYSRFVSGLSVNDIGLTEVQLIANNTGFKRHYQCDSDSVKDIERLISGSVLKMYGMDGTKKYKELSAEDFETIYYAYSEQCYNCPFQKPCKQIEP
ncbi:PD-(D/E)XK nuclease family protein [Runella slithyformis]|uniref:PD-(D/E)XK endonuclease-like domain-containing protein n=1 Tax=Runella slithyformis (strain ATCC 29530 / DSM 19594 / LMG 11500 / NCIMB 11436 / LSU 4) TaxID=761193 RepID=A0A7U4E9A7_RUNSL|nr:PD-(D/E)XK nuclease family protein [Runella slithyformis]AEI52169.1 hypothetical protein Runsl_5873 [Runella slithyformis DSM 19594]